MCIYSGAVPAEAFLFYCGAATWAPGQLEQEMAKGYWVASQGPPHLALEHRPKLWYELLTALGRRAQHAQHAQGGQNGAGTGEERKGKGGGRHVNGYSEAAALPEKGLERVEPLAFD